MRQNQKLFHTEDLAMLWQTTNRNTLYTTIKRYVKRGILIPVHKGLYSTLALGEVDIKQVGLKHVHGYSYVSTETVLAEAGVITQEVKVVSLVGERSVKFKINGVRYSCRRMVPKYLYQSVGINMENGVRSASVARAVVDLRYFNPGYQLDGLSLVDVKEIKKIKKEMGL